MICRLCHAVSHYKHSVETIDGAVTRITPKLEENLDKLTTIKQEHAERIAELNEVLEQNITREYHLKNEAKKHLDDVIAQARSQYEKIVLEVEENREKDKEQVLKEITKLEKQAKLTEFTLDWTDKVLSLAKQAS